MQIDDIEDMAKKCMETTGRHSPQIFLEKPPSAGKKGELIMFMLIYGSDDERDIICGNIRSTISMLNIDRYWFVSDAYLGNNPFIRPSNDKNSKECLIILEFRRDLKDKSIFNFYKRKEGKVVWVDRVVNIRGAGGGEGFSCWNFFVEDATEDNIRNVRVDFLFENAKKHPMFQEILAEGKMIGKTEDDIKRIIKKILEGEYAKAKAKTNAKKG